MEIIKDKIFNLFSHCKLVKGYTRAIICDLQRNDIYPIPLTLYEILLTAGRNTYEKLFNICNEENRITLEEYFNYLTKYELIFFHNSPELFPEMNEFWDEPFEITNCITDFKSVNYGYIENLSYKLNCIPIKALQIRIFNEIKFEDLKYILSHIKPVGLNSIEIIVKYSKTLSLKVLQELCRQFNNIFAIIVFGSKENRFIYGDTSFGQIYYMEESISSEKSCGIISPSFFTINTKTYTESISYNSCLNRKLSIDAYGYIKNCPSMHEYFGNISNISILEVINKPEFRKLWTINKDKISICKDCEFRYICTDCRAYLEDPIDILSKPLKCGYNPYTGIWDEWFLDLKKVKVIEYYDTI